MRDDRLTSGDVLEGRYRVVTRIGRGGMADVYRAEDLAEGRPVALKVFRDDIAEAVDPSRTTRETKLLSGVHHPTVVEVLGASSPEAQLTFLVMELVPGCDLGHLVGNGPLEPERAREIACDVADALALLHERRLVHRDVKPANILVLDGEAAAATGVAAKLTDLGIALAVDDTRLTATDSILGTAAYLSPEQVRGGAVGPASDVYSLGLVLIESLTGERAYSGGLAEAAVARLNRPPTLPGTASPALAALLARMTALDPDLRPSASEVAQSLRDLAGDMTADQFPETAAMSAPELVSAARAELEPEPAPVPSAPPTPRPHLTGLLAAAAALIVVLGSGVGLMLAGPARPTAELAAVQPLAGDTVQPSAPPSPAPSPSATARPADHHLTLASNVAPRPTTTHRKPAPTHAVQAAPAPVQHATAKKQSKHHKQAKHKGSGKHGK
jgi:serine/threonine protein kinase